MFFTFASISVSAAYKVLNSVGCPDSITSTITVEKLQDAASYDDDFSLYVGVEGVTLAENVVGAKQIHVYGCKDAEKITFAFDESNKNKKYHFENITVQISENANLSDIHFDELKLLKATMQRAKPAKIIANALLSDYVSTTVEGIHSIDAKTVAIHAQDYKGVSLDSNVAAMSAEETKAKSISIYETALFGFRCEADKFDVNVKNLTKPVIIAPMAAKSQIKFTSYDSTIQYITINNTGYADLQIFTHDVASLNLTYTDNTNKPLISLIPTIDDSLNVGQIIGIVIACLLIIATILLCVFITRCEKNEQLEEQEIALKEQNEDVSE